MAQQAAESLAPTLNRMLEEFEAGAQDADHIQSFGFKLRSMIMDEGLAEVQRIPPAVLRSLAQQPRR